MGKSRGLTGAETLLRVLGAMGVERIFASPGSEWAPVWEALAAPCEQQRPLYLSSRHEEIAVSVASGYAKASGKLAAVMIHTTVGALHASMALRAAVHEQIPMVVLCGESVGFGEEEGPDPSPWWLAQLADVGGPARLAQACVKWSFALNSAALFSATLERACQLAVTLPRGPVLVSIPMEYLLATLPESAAPRVAAAPAPTADPAAIEQLADLLATAAHPVIIAEYSGRNARIVELTVELAEALAATVVETGSTGYLNFPRNHPLHGGFEPREHFEQADAVLLLGAIGPWHPPSRGPNAKVAVMDESPLRPELPYWGFASDLIIAGAMESSLERLVERVKSRLMPNDAGRGRRAQEIARAHEQRRREWNEQALAVKSKRPIDMRRVVCELNEVLPRDARVIEETITHRLAIHRYLDAIAPGAYFAGCIGGLGTGLGTALGVKAAEPQRPVVCLIGDGSFHYDPALAALGFCQEHRMPILIVLFNNLGYLSQKSGIPRYFPEGQAVKQGRFIGISISPSPEYAMIAQAFGGHGEKVEDPGDLRAALQRGFEALERGQLALLDVRLDPVNPEATRPA